ncbi:RNA polymerase II subunit A C-terminal domain phosphatase [Choanephora cucurbitarum]|uniref:RNA polymerase II subunit A C-terminal domain phosphatase n=1 Tax=Choanephora cucurbitarum TaxID=101091 RepID=A0A1C7NMH1_9FUNG|nr:RNA polymerase II subunit A C-terminal domain phosphatase [Choanephora cucurbitarum]
METCKHQIQYNGLCAVCGTLLEAKPTEAYANMGYDITGLSVSREEAEKLESENAKRLLKARKLSLILDLDQTIIHASCDPKYEKHTQESNIRQFVLQNNTVYYVKLRPGLEEFLKELDKLYELHIYTMGNRDYADAITKEIDPTGSIFKERVLSRDESGSVTQKKLQRLFPCDISMVVVLDDRSDVWNSAPNLIRIKPYEFFVDRKNSITQAVAEKNDDPDWGADNELMVVLKILQEVHHKFYSIPSEQADVTCIIPNMKKQVLANIKITFSDKILSTQHIKDPTLSWIWQMATSFGATCSVDLTGKTTHLIAINNSRNKVKAAREYGHNIHIVTPAWLLDSTARWQVQPEENYAVVDVDRSERTPLDSESVPSEMPTPQEKELENINWDEANREVEDFINESGIDDVWDDTDSDTIDIPWTTQPLWKRKRESGGESGGDGSEDEESSLSGSFLARRKLRATKRGKSQLSKVTTAPSSRCTSGNTTDNEDSSLDAFVGMLDRELE